MNFKNNKISDLKIAYIGGGSRAWAWTLMNDLAKEKDLSGEVRLYDINHKASKVNERIGNDLTKRKDVKGKFKYKAINSLSSALNGVDIVFISILPGTFDEMESDVHTPERLGIYQSVGDTTGPGGIIRALRTIPMFKEFALAIKKYCPDAWVINYTNPMALCVRTLYKYFPNIKAFGCCHEVFAVQEMLAHMLEKQLKIKKITKDEINVDVIGINHFTWFKKASYKNYDIFPILKEYISKHFKEGFVAKNSNWFDSYFSCAHRVKFDLFNKYGILGAAGDRHLSEFMPGNIYLKNEKTANEWKFSLTPVSWRKKDLKNRLERSKRLYERKEKMVLRNTGEEGIRLIKALCGNDRVISNVNLPNSYNQIIGFPNNTVVETNAVFSKNGIKPICAGSFDSKTYKLMEPHTKIQDLVIDAATTYDINKVYEAFMLDPLVKGRASKKEIKLLVKDMIKNTINYLPKEWNKYIS